MMRWKRGGNRSRSGIDLLEEALFVLRHAQPSILISYLTGTIPFVLGLLYFWTDMSRSPFAAAHVGQSALGMSALYLWMKVWHSVFANRLLSSLTGEPPQSFSTLRIIRLIAAQVAVQAYCWFVIPICAITVVLFPWALAFFHSFSITGDGNHDNLRSAIKRAWSLANLWQPQNYVMVFLLAWFTLSVFLGIGIVILFIPFLLDALFGIETVFTRAGLGALLNSTFFAVAASLTYLCVNPLLKIAYVLRAFYGQSLRTGADLQAELRAIEVSEERPVVSRARRLILSIVMIGLFCTPVNAEEAQQTVAPDQLNESIEQVIHQREYQWRIPREEQDIKSDNTFLLDFLKGVQDTLERWFNPLWSFFKKVLDWIFDKIFPSTDPGSAGDKAPISNQTVFIAILISVAVLLLGLLLYRMWKRRQKDELITAEEASVAIPDVTDESTTADQFPEEGWLALAREYIERGELRLALRALYLSSLALLSRRGILTITKYKSNREYKWELQRKAQTNPDLLDAFQENLFLFERSWYGEHEVNGEIISRFNLNQERIREVA